MYRMLALFCFIATISLAGAVEQDKPENDKIKATPEVLALFEESLQSLDQVEPDARAKGLFQLLGFAACLDDKAPAAKVIDALTVLAPTVEPEELRNQLYEGIAHTLCEHEDYAEAVGTLQRIVQSADRYKRQLNLALKILFGHEQDKTLKPFDASELIRQAVGGAVESQDVVHETLGRAILGRELARQGKLEESAAAFAEALRIAQRLEDVTEKIQVVQLIIQSQVLYGQLDAAQTTARAIDDPPIQRITVGTLIQALIQHEKYDEAEAMIKALPADDEGRPSFVQQWIAATIKTISDEKIGEMSALLPEEHREPFLQVVTKHLQKIDRGDTAIQVGKRLKEPAMAGLALFVGKVESLVEAKQFAEAIQFIDASKEDELFRQQLKRQVLIVQFDETHADAVAQQIAETFTGEEKVAAAELREEAAEAAKNQDDGDQMDVLFEVLLEQFQFGDIAGARQTLGWIAEQIGKESDLAATIQYRLILARLQAELRDNKGMKDNLGKLMQLLDVKDVKVFKDLVPEPESAPAGTASSRIRVELPAADSEPAVDVPAIQDRLFLIYVDIAELFADADAPAESTSALDKAKELARLDSNALQRAEKLLALAQILAE